MNRKRSFNLLNLVVIVGLLALLSSGCATVRAVSGGSDQVSEEDINAALNIGHGVLADGADVYDVGIATFPPLCKTGVVDAQKCEIGELTAEEFHLLYHEAVPLYEQFYKTRGTDVMTQFEALQHQLIMAGIRVGTKLAVDISNFETLAKAQTPFKAETLEEDYEAATTLQVTPGMVEALKNRVPDPAPYFR
jgi:hypothetical protein